MTIEALARLIGYLAAVGLGVYMTVHGVQHDSPDLVTSGIALVGVGGLASANVPRTGARHAEE